MSYFDYKVVPAPRRVKPARGVTAAGDLFALTLTEAINAQAHQGWEYVRAESMTAETPRGWFRRAVVEEQTVLVFRRERETLGPRIAPAPEAAAAPVEHPRPPRDREAPERRPEDAGRREPVFDASEPEAAPASPLRPEPRLRPVDPA